MIICNYYENQINITWEAVPDADGYMLYRKTGEHLYTSFKEAKNNHVTLFGICKGEEIKIKPFLTQNGKKIFNAAQLKIIIGEIDYKNDFETIININKSSANIAWNPIKNANKYKIYLNNEFISETTRNEFNIKLLPVGESAIRLEAFNNNQLLNKSNNITVNIDTMELFGINTDKKILLYWNKVNNIDGYRIFKKNFKGEFGGFISSQSEEIITDNITNNEFAEFKVKPFVLKDGQREFTGLSAKTKIKVCQSDKILLSLNKAYGSKLALSWIFNGDVDGYDIFKNGEFILNIADGLSHITLIDFSKDNYVIKGYKNFKTEKLYTCESYPVSITQQNNRKNKPESYKLSVIIPSYNSQDYISRTISTVLASTLDDIELIIVDDESSDKTREIINWYAKEYPNYVKKIFKKNSGVADTRNKGIEFAAGKYIAFMDNDDMIRPQGFETLYNTITKTNSDIVVSPIYRIDNDKYITRHKLPFEENIAIDTEEYLKLIFSDQYSNVGIWNKLYRSELVKSHPLGIQAYEDVAWTPCILSWADKISYAEDICYEWDRKIRTATFSNILSGRTPEEKFVDRYDAVKYFYENGNPKHKDCLAYLMAKRLYGQGLKAKYSKYFEAISNMKEELINNKFLLEDKEYFSKIHPLIEN